MLLQQVGRLHRHQRDHRPLGFRRRDDDYSVRDDRYTIRESSRDGEVRGPYGIGTVYQNVAHLELVRYRIAREPMVLPGNRDIVEATCSARLKRYWKVMKAGNGMRELCAPV